MAFSRRHRAVGVAFVVVVVGIAIAEFASEFNKTDKATKSRNRR